jgi:CRP/FNR family transcriptional regulator, anaerobic regulatory protein
LTHGHHDRAEVACATCTARDSGIWRALNGKSDHAVPASSKRLTQVHQTAHAGQLIYRSGERAEGVDVVCDGWAFTFIMLSDGRRQILSFLLPGDVVATSALLKDRLGFSIQALTDLRFCRFSKTELRSQMAAEPRFFDEYASIWVTEKEESDQLATDLGRRTADERIARLILALMTRLDARGMVENQSFAFPLRQRHIADATGLTPVHVSRVIGGFRAARLIDITGRLLRVLDLDQLRRVSSSS